MRDFQFVVGTSQKRTKDNVGAIVVIVADLDVVKKTFLATTFEAVIWCWSLFGFAKVKLNITTSLVQLRQRGL